MAKHVPSSAPGPGPQDASADLQRHRGRPDAGPTHTAPPGGWPETAGSNPDAPVDRQSSGTDDVGTGFTSPGAYSQATAFHPMGADY